MSLDPQHRYLILRRGVPVYTTDDVTMLLVYLWGRRLRDRYVVYDYERPYPWDTTDLCTWLKPLEAAAR
jgi:hypothetical protein